MQISTVPVCDLTSLAFDGSPVQFLGLAARELSSLPGLVANEFPLPARAVDPWSPTVCLTPSIAPHGLGSFHCAYDSALEERLQCLARPFFSSQAAKIKEYENRARLSCPFRFLP